MKLTLANFFVLLIAIILYSCNCKENNQSINENASFKKKVSIVVGANQTESYLSILKGKKVAVVANQTSVVFKSDSIYVHLVDTLLARNIVVSKVFAPEHGFRGKADAGEHVSDGVDKKTGLPINSLYGKNRKPSPEMMKDIDFVGL